MARARNIKPSFFQDDKLGELPIYSRMAFIGLWTLADFKGCLEFRPKMLKVQLLPYDECNIEEVVNALEEARFIRYYSVDEKKYIKIVNFEKHQNPHKNERDSGSDIPDFTETSKENNVLDKDGTKPDLIGTARADSLLLIPDSRKPTSQPGAGERYPEKFQMHLDWNPSEEFPTLAKMAMVDVPQEIGEFIAYWKSQPLVVRTQSEWDHTLLKNLINAKLRAAAGMPQATAKQSKFDPVKYVNEDEGAGDGNVIVVK